MAYVKLMRFLLRSYGLDPRRAPHFGIASSEAPEADRFAFPAQPGIEKAS